MQTARFLLMIVAGFCFLLSAFDIKMPRINLTGVGLLFLTCALMVSLNG